MKFCRIAFFVLLLFIVIPALLYSQHFGKNKVQYTHFHWQFLQSEHFDVYFSQGGQGIAEFAAEIAEKAYASLQSDFRYDLLDRIMIIVHNSHNDFGQTNVDLSPPEESVGGFTEFFKNRVVVPYEGDWEKFRHVIRHELTHAIMLQMVYGVGVQSIVAGISRMQLPLWFIEGLAEYQSLGWDNESDMFMRDATINGFLPDIEMLSHHGYMAYKGGQSVLYFLSQKYGDAKIGEILNKMKINRSSENGLKKAIGLSTEELTDSWHKFLKQSYWPDIGARQEPREIGKQLTYHKKWQNFININPALSPRGDQVAFLSDKNDFFDIYLLNTIDARISAKLVKGQRTGSLEELHWLKGPSISWSPNGQFIVFSAKAESGDRLHIVDVKNRKIVQDFRLPLDGIYNPTWNPQTDKVAFVGLKNGQSDLYCIDLTSSALERLTEDVFSEAEPSWSPDGERLLFASDRGPYLQPEDLPENFALSAHDLSNYDIYELSVRENRLRRIIDDPYSDRTPAFSPDGKVIAFTSDRSGITNIYLHDLETGTVWPITNVLTCAMQPTWSGNRLAFTSFYNGGFDIFLLSNPLDIQPGSIRLEQTEWMKKATNKPMVHSRPAQSADSLPVLPGKTFRSDTFQFRDFIFDENFASGKLELDAEKQVVLPKDEYRTAAGEFKVSDYRIKFTPDLVNGAAGYDQFYGIQGSSQLSFSDMMGNHRINVYTNFFYDFRNSDYMLSYFYLPHRIDFGIGGYHNAYFLWSYPHGIIRDRNWGLNLYLSRPFNRYQRLDGGINFMGIDRSFLEIEASPSHRRIFMTSLSWIKDTSVWGLEPVNGSRSSYGITYSPGIAGANGVDFMTLRFDQRNYFKIARDYSFAVRWTAGFSTGKHPQRFYLGGVPNWINRSFHQGMRIVDVDDIYFASFEMPLRGANYYQLEGNRFSILNLEFRFPLIQHLLLGWPLPLGFKNIRGAFFADIGTAWYRDEQRKLRWLQQTPAGELKLNAEHSFFGYGFGIRTHLGIFLLNLEFAWPARWSAVGSRKIYWSLGTSF